MRRAATVAFPQVGPIRPERSGATPWGALPPVPCSVAEEVPAIRGRQVLQLQHQWQIGGSDARIPRCVAQPACTLAQVAFDQRQGLHGCFVHSRSTGNGIRGCTCLSGGAGQRCCNSCQRLAAVRRRFGHGHAGTAENIVDAAQQDASAALVVRSGRGAASVASRANRTRMDRSL